ncbi:MAG: SUMF1/EgtB/PvdO family nonheme iron enzyme [Limisphaerales bacterium]
MAFMTWREMPGSGVGTTPGLTCHFPTDPRGPATDQGSGRVGRGGNWNFYATDCRNSYRYGNSPAYSASNIGFRCALSVP